MPHVNGVKCSAVNSNLHLHIIQHPEPFVNENISMCHTDFMNDTLLKSYNRSFNGGKSRFARICDNVFFGTAADRRTLFACFRESCITAPRLCLPQCSFPRQYCSLQSLLRSLRFNAHIKNSAKKHPSRFCGAGYCVSPEVGEVIRSLHRSSRNTRIKRVPEQSATRSFYLLRN